MISALKAPPRSIDNKGIGAVNLVNSEWIFTGHGSGHFEAYRANDDSYAACELVNCIQLAKWLIP